MTDLAEAHLAALAWLKAGEPGRGRAFNLGTGKGLSVLEIVAAGERVMGKTPPHELAGRRAGDPPRLVADPSAAQATFGWRATRSDADTLIRTAAAFERARSGN